MPRGTTNDPPLSTPQVSCGTLPSHARCADPEGYYADDASALEAHKEIEAEDLARAKELHARVAEWMEKNPKRARELWGPKP
jgi:hypothetical protein